MPETKSNKPDDWFSRRHKTREAHDNAVATYKAGSSRHKAKLARRQRMQSAKK